MPTMYDAIETAYYAADGVLVELADDSPTLDWGNSLVRYRVTFHPDLDPMNPREMTDSALTEIVTFRHDRHGLGDRGPTPEESTALEHGGWAGLTRHLIRNGAVYIAPISGIDHSGISVWIAQTPNETSPFDSAGWDSGQWGFILVRRAWWAEIMAELDPLEFPEGETVSVRVGFGSVEMRASRAELAARAEFAEYAAYVSGDVFGYSIAVLAEWIRADIPGNEIRRDWEPVGGCSGFYGWDDSAEYAREMARDELAGIVSAANPKPEPVAVESRPDAEMPKWAILADGLDLPDDSELEGK